MSVIARSITGASFVTFSATTPNLRVMFVPYSALGIGACATTWFQAQVGDQRTTPLGNPSYDCH